MPTSRTLTVLVAALMGCADPPHARFDARWVPFFVTTAGAGAYDSTRLRFRGDTAEVWMRFQHATPMPLPTDSTDSYTLVQAAANVHCASEQIQDIRMMVGRPDADSLGGYTNDTLVWAPFSGHAMPGWVLSGLCAALSGRGGT